MVRGCVRPFVDRLRGVPLLVFVCCLFLACSSAQPSAVERQTCVLLTGGGGTGARCIGKCENGNVCKLDGNGNSVFCTCSADAQPCEYDPVMKKCKV